MRHIIALSSPVSIGPYGNVQSVQRKSVLTEAAFPSNQKRKKLEKSFAISGILPEKSYNNYAVR